MGVNSRVFHLIATHCKRAPAHNGAMLAAGYPDMLVDRQTLNKHFGHANFPADRYSSEIVKGHARSGTQVDIAPDPFAVFAALGYDELTVIDIHKERGCEELVDLNYPAERRRFSRSPLAAERYDLVLDHGTIEHCFNIAEAAHNLAATVKENGFMVHHLPANMYNHGFYNLNPTWFYDFYETNGFKMVHFEGWSLDGLQPFTVEPFKDFATLPRYSLFTMIAQRAEVKPLAYPIQRKYRNP